MSVSLQIKPVKSVTVSTLAISCLSCIIRLFIWKGTLTALLLANLITDCVVALRRDHLCAVSHDPQHSAVYKKRKTIQAVKVD
jgi:hypothetical protein